jgi:hypothetical protein
MDRFALDIQAQRADFTVKRTQYGCALSALTAIVPGFIANLEPLALFIGWLKKEIARAVDPRPTLSKYPASGLLEK